MSENKKRFDNVFCDVFETEASALNENFTSEAVEAWDSIAHMNLIAALEDEFEIEFEGDDLMELQSYQKGLELIAKYGIEI